MQPGEIRKALRGMGVIGHNPPATVGLRRLDQVLTDDDITKTVSANYGARRHPVGRLLQAAATPRDDQPVDELLSLAVAVGAIHRAGSESWLENAIGAALDITPTGITNASAALGEIRCYGGLLLAQLDAEPLGVGSSPRSDFVVHDRATEEPDVLVEVTTKHMHEQEANALATARSPRPPQAEGVSSRLTFVSPFGPPERGENTTLNVAHKVASIKATSHQARPGLPFVVWIDMQSEDMWSTSRAVIPLASHKAALYSGGIWLGAYGDRGDPVLEGHPPEPTDMLQVPMNFPGRFAQDSAVSAMYFAFGSSTVAFEAPSPANRIPTYFAQATVRLPRFNWERSWLAWPGSDADLRARIKIAKSTAKALAVSDE